MRDIRGMWLARLKGLSRPGRRSSVAIASASAAVLLIVGGIAFAGQTTQSTQVINQAASLFHPSSPSKDGTTSGGTGGSSGSSSSKSDSSKPSANGVTTPSTIIGPHGETIVLPPLSSKPGAPATGTTVPSSSSATPLDTVLPPPTTPASVTSTTARPAPSNGPASPTAAVQVTNQSIDDPSVGLQVTGADADGYITSISIAWFVNDPNPTTFTYPISSCVDQAGTQQSEAPSHEYADAGSYSIAVTVTSEDCSGDASSAQQAIAATSVVAGGTTPPVTTADGNDQSDPQS